jgi:hypothetical protein
MVSGSVYIGDFVDGKRHGQGKLTLLNGTYYEGGWVNDGLEGKAKYVSATQSYEGDYVNGMEHGIGKSTASDGEVYIGEFYNGKATGKERLITANGDIYEGEWKDGNSVNVYQVNADNSKKASESSNDNLNPSATVKRITYDEKRYYIGQVVDGAANGQGKYFFDGILAYEGQFKDDVPNGEGKFYYDNGNVMLEGYFRDYVLNGKGKKYSENGNLDYEGDWERGAPHGVGIAYNDDGTISYEGEFKNGIMDGTGRFTMSTGHLVEGQWKNGKFIQGTERIITNASTQSSINYEDIVKCKNCGKSFYMKDGYVRTLTNPRAYLGHTQIYNIKFAESSGYPQSTINSLITNVKYGDWYCSKKCAWEDGVEPVDE